MILALLLFLFAQADDRVELRKTEIELEIAKRLLPPEFVLADEERFVRAVAGQAGVNILRIETPPPTGSPLHVHALEISGSGDMQQIEDFVTFLSKRPTRLADLASLHVGRDGRFVLRYVLPVLGELPQAPPTGDPAADVREHLTRVRALRDAITSFRSPRFDDALALFDVVSDDPAVRITELSLADKRLLRGVVVGAAARARIAKIAGVKIAPNGACRAFAIGAAPVDDVLCAADRPPTVARFEVRGKDGPITLNLREAELADFFFALHGITGESFVLAPDVRGLVTVNIENATLDEVLRATGLTIEGTRLRRVTRTPTRELTQEYIGDPINLQLRNAHFPSILCLFQELTGLEMSVAEPSGRPAIFTSEVPWDLALEALVVTSGFTYELDGTKMYVGPQPAVKERRVRRACELAASSPSRFSDLHLKLEELGRDDLTIAGVARKGDEWSGFAYGPGRQLYPLAPGQTLFDARVKSVGPSGVVFEKR